MVQLDLESKIEIAKKYGCDFVINYKKESFDKKVLEITDNVDLVLFTMVLENTFEKSINCLKPRGMMVSFGNSSGALEPINVKKFIAAKSLFFTRPGLTHYAAERSELEDGASSLFDAVKFGKIKVKIFKEYSLSDTRKAHEDLGARKIIGPALLIPNE